MSLQLNVQQQIEARKAEIRRAVGLSRSGAVLMKWLRPLFESNGVPLTGGLLVQFVNTPEQSADLHSGLWLTPNREFWEFAVLVSRDTGELVEVESISNVTGTIGVEENLPGIQKSFGALALEVFTETLHD